MLGSGYKIYISICVVIRYKKIDLFYVLVPIIVCHICNKLVIQKQKNMCCFKIDGAREGLVMNLNLIYLTIEA